MKLHNPFDHITSIEDAPISLIIAYIICAVAVPVMTLLVLVLFPRIFVSGVIGFALGRLLYKMLSGR